MVTGGGDAGGNDHDNDNSNGSGGGFIQQSTKIGSGRAATAMATETATAMVTAMAALTATTAVTAMATTRMRLCFLIFCVNR
jgi:hypothetical protein